MGKTSAIVIGLSTIAIGLGVPAACLYATIFYGFNSVTAAIVAIAGIYRPFRSCQSDSPFCLDLRPHCTILHSYQGSTCKQKGDSFLGSAKNEPSKQSRYHNHNS